MDFNTLIQCCFPADNSMVCQDKKLQENKPEVKIEIDKKFETRTAKQPETFKNEENVIQVEKKENNPFNSFSSFAKADIKVEVKEESKEEKKMEIPDLVTNRYITDDEINKAKNLLLEELTDKEILHNNKLLINAGGLVNGNRKSRDGVAFFGRALKNGETIPNDYDLNIDFPSSSSYIFIIYYNVEYDKYYIRAFKDKLIPGHSVLMIKLHRPHTISKKEVISTSDYFFQLDPQGDNLDIQRLAIKNNQVTESYSFNASIGKITVGRDSKCIIPFVGDKSLSKIQFTILYDTEINSWVIMDGIGEKLSTNGTWIFAAHSYEITDKTIFRIGNSRLLLSYK